MTTTKMPHRDGSGNWIAAEVVDGNVFSPHSVPEVAGAPVSASNPMPTTPQVSGAPISIGNPMIDDRRGHNGDEDKGHVGAQHQHCRGRSEHGQKVPRNTEFRLRARRARAECGCRGRQWMAAAGRRHRGRRRPAEVRSRRPLDRRLERDQRRGIHLDRPGRKLGHPQASACAGRRRRRKCAHESTHMRSHRWRGALMSSDPTIGVLGAPCTREAPLPNRPACATPTR